MNVMQPHSATFDHDFGHHQQPASGCLDAQRHDRIVRRLGQNVERNRVGA